jgi:hypothetical protein
MYGVSRNTLREIARLDQRRHAAEYAALKRHANELKTRRTDKQKTRQKSVKGSPPNMSLADYYGRATYCPVCRHDFNTNFIPRHGAGPHGCNGSGKFGASLYTIYLDRRAEKQLKGGGRSTGVRTVSGGLPGLGRRH